ncbi:hypothetical protein EMCRGX_G016607 [Ephydatia muelleri]
MNFLPLSTENSSSGANDSCSKAGSAGREALVMHTLAVAAAVGLTSSIVSILIVLATRSYRRFVHRLYLYLAVAGAWISIGQFAYWGRTEGVQLKREKLILLAVLVAPVTLCWVPATVFGLRWNTVACDAGLALVPIAVVIVLVCLVSIAALVVVIATLFRGIFGKGAMFPVYHRKALKEVMPVFALVLVVQLAGVLLLLVYAHYAEVGIAIYSSGSYQVIAYALPGVFVGVPVLLILDLLVCTRRLRASNSGVEERSALTGGSMEEPSMVTVASSKI